MVYDKEYAILNENMDTATPPTLSKLVAKVVQAIATAPTFTSDSIAELTKQFTQLALAMQASMQSRLLVRMSNVNAPLSFIY